MSMPLRITGGIRAFPLYENQHEDLTAAQAELEKIILELDTGMRRQFKEKFSEIRSEFDRVFKELFGEDGDSGAFGG